MRGLCVFLLLIGVHHIASQGSNCGGDRYLTTESGAFTSMNFDGTTPYDRLASCEWNIDIPDTLRIIELSFDYFDVEGMFACNYDAVEAYDGVDNTAPVIAKLCGHNLPEPVFSTGPSMYVTFTSDNTVQWTGFSALYITRDPPVTCTSPEYLCGDDYTGYCAPLTERCDGIDHCPDRKDELGCSGNREKCGKPAIRPSFRTNIVGGVEAVPHSWPWQISMYNGKSHSCGGSILNEKWIITAAHCCNAGAQAGNYLIYDVNVGEHNLTAPEPSQAKYAVDLVISHENYNPSTLDNDIALMRVKDQIVMSDEVSEICLPTQGQTYTDGVPAWITGWGNTQNENEDQRALRQAQTQFLDTAKCNTPESYNGEVTENMFCAGYLEGGIDTCQGDSGGPLVYYDEPADTYILAGLTSWGEGCALPNKPGVYTKVSQYVDWVNNHIHNNP